MPWLVGIDEAGYGPNLGPLVMTSVACRLPGGLVGVDLWRVLRLAVRRRPSARDGRLFVDDSKVVYSAVRGLCELETSVLAALCPWAGAAVLAGYVDQVCAASHAALREEPWYAGDTALPVEAERPRIEKAAGKFRELSAREGIAWGPVHSVVVCPRQFNACLDQWGSKGAALGSALAVLLSRHRELDGPDESITFVIDKHGGRNAYAPMLQHALPEGVVVAREEGSRRSSYQVLGLGRELRVLIQPRADGEHFTVALASMASKYLRELLMREFNRYWQGHLPELAPTAGYPGDARRFFEQIRPVADRLGISEAALWRRK